MFDVWIKQFDPSIMFGNPNRRFKGYRTFPTYLERVTNYMTHIRHQSSEQDYNEDQAEEQIYEDQQDQYYNSANQGNENPEEAYESQELIDETEDIRQNARSNLATNSMYSINMKNANKHKSHQSVNRMQQQMYAQPSQVSSRSKQRPQNESLNSAQSKQLKAGNDRYNKSMSSYNQIQPEKANARTAAREPERITTADLRNKRSNVANNTYKGYGGYNKREGPKYSVKMAIGSGGYHMDSM